MSVLPAATKRSMRVVVTDFDLSMIVSVPTSMRPIDLGSMLNFSRRPETAVRKWSRKFKGRERDVFTIEGKGIDIFTVIWPCHILLAEANGIFSLGNAVKLLEVSLGDALRVGLRTCG